MKDTNNRIETLAKLIKKYQDSYYEAEAEVSDAEFDLLWDELKKLSPDHPLLQKVGGGTDGFPKAKHLIPMGSQEKAANPDEFRTWVQKVKPQRFVVQYKLDGASLELQYEKGILLMALTRGDGIIGDNISANALLMDGVLSNITKSFSGGVRGEVVMTRDIWQEKYPGKANCRNAANGIMRRKDGVGNEDLTFIAYDVALNNNDEYFKTEIEKINWLKTQGFQVTETREFTECEEIIHYRNEIAENRKNMNLDIDGLVVKDLMSDMSDLRRARPERQIAFKFDLEIAYSILTHVEWSESGATYTPIGIIEPIRLAGTIVKRANLNNPDMIRSLGLKIGSAVVVVKRGEIIPKIEGLAPEGVIDEPASKEEIHFPLNCASCNTLIKDIGTRLYCPNPACSKRLHHKLKKWVSVLDIRELGDKLLRQLFDTGRVQHIPDLYSLTEAELADYQRMGELSAAKVIRHIKTKRELSLSEFVAGFNLEGVGELIMEKLTFSGFDTLEKLRSASVEDISGIHGLGEITAETIFVGLKEYSSEMDQVLATGYILITPPVSIEELPLGGLSFCFTGELKTMKRNQAVEKVKALGGSVKESVVKDLSWLVTNDTESGSAKNNKALKLGVKIIDELAFLALLDGKKTPAKEKPKQPELF